MWPYGKGQQKLKCTFFFFVPSGGKTGGGWVCAHLLTIHLLKRPSEKLKHFPAHTNTSSVTPTSSLHNLSQHDFILLSPANSAEYPPHTHTPSSGLTCVAACGVKGVCVRGSVCGRVCESMLQDSGTPSLFAPLSASAEPLSASLEEPLGPKANYPRTRPPRRRWRYQSAFGGGGGGVKEGWGLGWSCHQSH